MEEIKYSLIYSRRRTISIIVSPARGVIVRAPYRTSVRRIDDYVHQKSDWIRKHLRNHSQLIRINNNKEYKEGESHLFMGREVILKLTLSAKSFVLLNDNILEARTKNPENRIIVKSLIDKWYMEQACLSVRQMLESILSEFKIYDFSPKSVAVKKLRSRWGSCSSKGVITISSELIKLDLIFTRYVILHELCHLRFHNHGKEFYALLEELVPDYKSVRKELRKFITK